MTEEWRAIPGYEGIYDVSNLGRVRSHHRYRSPGKMLAQRVGKRGYLVIQLCREGRVKHFTVHRLVALAFLGPCPEGQVVRHLNGNRLDPTLSNLAYGTHSENERDSVQHGTHVRAGAMECPNGHPYEVTATQLPSRPGRRHCIECSRNRSREYRNRRRARQRAAGVKVT